MATPRETMRQDRRERRCLELQTAFTSRSHSSLPLSRSLSFPLFLPHSSSCSLLAFFAFAAGVIKRMQSEIKIRQHCRHSTQIKSYVFCPCPLSTLPQTHTHTHTGIGSQLLICPAGQRVSHYNSPLYSSVTPQAGTSAAQGADGKWLSRRRGCRTHTHTQSAKRLLAAL